MTVSLAARLAARLAESGGRAGGAGGGAGGWSARGLEWTGWMAADLAPDETVILLTPTLHLLLIHLLKGEGGAAE